MCQAITEELRGIDLSDQRLNERSRMLLKALAADPSANTNTACTGWSETRAAYRPFDNENVEPEKIFQPHPARHGVGPRVSGPAVRGRVREGGVEVGLANRREGTPAEAIAQIGRIHSGVGAIRRL